MRSLTRIGAICAAVALLIPGATQAAAARYVFLFIGDGMGLTQTLAAQLYLSTLESDAYPPVPAALSYTGFQTVGLMHTQSADSPVTDSAAAATAMASGRKTDNGILNEDPDTGEAYVPLAHTVKAGGRRVGLVTTCSLNHATPAAFYAHATDRYDYYEIGLQALRPGLLDFLGGGGFSKASGPAGDQVKLTDTARERGFAVTSDAEEIRTLGPDAAPVIAQQPGTYTAPFMERELDRIYMPAETLSLAEMVAAAIRVLDDADGFFLMAESGMVDTACAENDAAGAIYEVLALSDAVGAAVAFYERHPSDTLIVVLADHETGGLSLLRRTDLAVLAHQRASFARFEEEVRALLKKEAAYEAIEDAVGQWFGLKEETQVPLFRTEVRMLRAAYEATVRDELTEEEEELYQGLNPLAFTACKVMARHARLSFITTGHTAQSVPVYAMGAGAELFGGTYDNTAVYNKLIEAMGL